MSRYALAEGGIVTNVAAGYVEGWNNVTDVLVGGKRVSVGWTFDGANYAPPAPIVPAVTYRKVLTGIEWVETWTADEWRSLKTASQGTTAIAKRLDQMMDAIRLTGSFNLESATATAFYDFLQANGYITAQRRAELTQGVPG